MDRLPYTLPSGAVSMAQSHRISTPAASRMPAGQKLSSASFLGLLATQFFGALNDNLFRWLAVPIGKFYVGENHSATVLAAGLACFVLPYILLAGPAGYL